MKSTVEALQLRYHILQNFEEALTVKDEKELQRKVFDAEEAIVTRLQSIDGSSDHHAERSAIQAASRALLFLKEQKLQYPMLKNEPKQTL
jgi:hypothetical protein